MRKEEYMKTLDDHMEKISSKLRKIKDPLAAEIRDELIKLGGDVVCTDTGIVMATAIETAHDLIKRIYNHTKHVHPDDGIHRMIECELRGDPFYGDILGEKKHG